MSSKFDGMSPQQIHDYFEAQEKKAREAYAGHPLPEISRVKRDDYPHWKVVAYEFHTSEGMRVRIDRGDGEQVEGALRGVRASTRGQDVLVVELDGLWGCLRADGSDWSPGDNGRVRVQTVRVPVRARRLDDPRAGFEEWTLQTNFEGQP